MSLDGARALALLDGLARGALQASAEELDELLARGLAVEADPEELALAGWLASEVKTLLHQAPLEPGVLTGLEAHLAAADKDLRSDWYRMTTSRAELDRREAERVTVRRALGLLRDPHVHAALRRLEADAARLAPGARYVASPAVGIEVYALTARGAAVARALRPRLERFGPSPLATFLQGFDKVSAKMQAFAGDLLAYQREIGWVKKNPHQVVIGLAKAGGRPADTLATYHALRSAGHLPDVAVTCTRNAATLGSARTAAERLAQAETALRRAGFPATPVMLGSAKSLLAFSPLERGVTRYVALKRGLDRLFGAEETNYKHTARLMAASGSPDEILARVLAASHALVARPSRHGEPRYKASTAVAIGAMARNPTAIDGAVTRLRELEAALAAKHLATTADATSLALECLACPGTADEVVGTIRELLGHLQQQASPTPGEIAMAVAFAKRFPL